MRYFFIFLLLLSNTSFGQTSKDTVEYLLNRDWVRCNPEQAYYYRLAYREDAYWRVKDFYLFSKTIQSNGLYADDSFTKPEGMHYWYYPDGKLKQKGRYASNEVTGIWKEYDEDGNIIDSSLFMNGMPWKFSYKWFKTGKISFKGVYDDSANGSGYETDYYYDGTISAFGKYAKGNKEDSVWTYNFKNGKPSCIEYYDNGVLLKRVCYDENGHPTECDSVLPVEQPGQFYKTHIYRYIGKMPQSDYDVTRFLGINIKYPRSARENDIEGKIYVRFIVDEDGNIISPKVENSTERTKALEKEAVRVVSMLPKWKPGREHNRPVKVYYTLPVVFRLED